jgi:hypothetical protein
MADTQAKSGMTGTSIDPGEPGVRSDDAAGSEMSVDRAAVGRASVPMEPAAAKISDSKAEDVLISAAPADRGTSPADRGVSPADRGAPATDRGAAPVGRGSAPPAMTRKAPAPPARVTAVAPGVDGTASAPNTGAARISEAVRTARATVSSAASRGPRRARLFVKRVDPWSVMKFSFAVSFVLFFVLVVATSVLYLALDQMNVFTSINKALAQLITSKNDVKVTATAVIGASGAIGLVMVVLFTAIMTLGAFIYNVCADLVGGIELTLAERD